MPHTSVTLRCFDKNETVGVVFETVEIMYKIILSCTPHAIMSQVSRVYGLSIWLELFHPFNSFSRDKDLHTLPKIYTTSTQPMHADLSDFFRDTIVICWGRRLQGDVI